MGLGFGAYKGIGIMEKKMETTVMGHAGIIGYILGLYRDNGKEHGNYWNTLGLYRDNGKNGNYNNALGLYWKGRC